MHYFYKLVLIWGGSFILIACNQSTKQRANLPLLSLVDPNESGLQFQNNLRESPSQNVLSYEYFYNGAGLAIGDFNQDELPDIYMISNLEANQFFLNKGNLNFEETTIASGLQGKKGFSNGVSTVDINADGWLDIYICRSGRYTQDDRRRNELYINKGPNSDGIPVFEEAAAQYGLDITAYSTQASFFDYDRDGDLDLFLINHDISSYPLGQIPELQQSNSELVGDMLFQNQNGQFVNVTSNSGIVNNKLGFGLGLGISDLNHDGWPDVYVSTDYSGRDHLYFNQQDGTFKEMVRELTNHTSFYSMGNDIADINNDGWQDIVNLDMVAEDNYGIKTSMSAMNPAQFNELVELGLHHQYMFNTLLLNNGVPASANYPLFSDIGQMLGISNTDWSWAPLLFDFNNDGNRDLFISNGIKRNIRNNDAVKELEKRSRQIQNPEVKFDRANFIRDALQLFPYHQKPNYFFLNQGNLQFQNINSDLGTDSLFTASNGAAYSDLDLDGDLDLVINNVDQGAMLFRNNSNEAAQGNYLQIQLNGPTSNPFGIGTRIEAIQEGVFYSAELYSTRGYLSAVEPLLHLGLASHKPISSLILYWPDGTTQRLENIPINQRLKISYSPSKYSDPPKTKPLFKPIENEINWQYKHAENDFDDFARESLLPHKMSQFGPAVAVGDVNGDGLEDVFIGGAKGQAAMMYVQESNGQVMPIPSNAWERHKAFEDVSAVFSDVDGDGDVDLWVGSGGNEDELESGAYGIRLYENQGTGKFQIHTRRIPTTAVSVGVLSVADIDQDGDEDLFVGGRQVPGKYPRPANSHIFINEGYGQGIYVEDKTEEWAPFLHQYGMVSDANWADINGDEIPDLITVGEWMSPKVLLNNGTQLIDHSKEAKTDSMVGWWFSVAIKDMDGDGDMDFVAGNLGLNYKYQSSKAEPFEVYLEDFDSNGSLDIVLGYYNGGTLYPLRGRECSSNQMPFIKTKFPNYNSFGQASLKDVYAGLKFDDALHYAATTFATSYFENDGSGSFTVQALPAMAQLSSTNSIVLEDFDEDGKEDILLAGNLFGSEVETPRNDASTGALLLGDGSGNFQYVPAFESGLQLKGEVKSLQQLTLKSNGQRSILVVKNNDFLQLLSY